jgi:putative cell wall-binding protein
VAYVATGATFPDALAAVPLAARTHSPVLLTRPDRLPGAVNDELRRLAPGRIVVLGSQGAVSAEVASALAELTPGSVSRLAGVDRYATAAAVAAALGPATSTYLATGVAFPDALAAGPAAASMGAVVLLTKPTALPAPTVTQLQLQQPSRLLVAGGISAVSDEVAAAAAAASR